MPILNHMRLPDGFRRWKVRDSTFVAAQWRPEEGLTAVVCKTGGARPCVLASSHLPDAQASPANVAALAQTLSATSIPWVWLLGREDYLLLVMDKPPLSTSEMSTGIAWALEPRLDFPADEASLAWMNIPQPDKEIDAKQVYAVASRRAIVNQTRKLFDEAGLALQVVDIAETAQRNLSALLEREDECLAILSFESAGALLTFTWRGELYLNRFIVQPVKDIDRAEGPQRERILGRLVNHYLQSLEFLESQYHFLRVSRLVVAPLPFDLEVVPRLAQDLPHAVESIDLSQWVDFGGLPQVISASAQARLWRVLGATLRQEGSGR